MPRRVLLIAVLVAGIAAIIAAQFSIPTLFDADGYLHIRMAEFLRRFGVTHEFHWARYSVFARHFADKDFLYHCALIPFTFLPNIFMGAKIAACGFAIAFFLVYVRCLRQVAHKALVPFYAAAVLLAPYFLQSLCRPRPMVLMILLTLLFTDALVRKRPWQLFFISACYTLTHVSSPILVLFALIAESVRWGSEREWSWKSLRAVAGGVIAGFLLHPQFPDNLLVFYLNGILVPKFAMKWGLELGAEFFPMDTRTLILGYPLLFWALGAICAAGAASLNRIRTGTRIWLAIGGFFLIGAFFSKRYCIHSYPMILVGSAAMVTDWWQSASRMPFLRRSVAAKTAVILAAAAICANAGLSTYRQFLELARNERVYNGYYESAAEWMNKNIPPGELIFHANWSDSQFFIGLSPQNDYFVTLDPIYMYYWDREKYKLYRRVAFGDVPDVYSVLKQDFGVRYGYISKDYFEGLISRVRADSRFQVLAEGPGGLFFMLK